MSHSVISAIMSHGTWDKDIVSENFSTHVIFLIQFNLTTFLKYTLSSIAGILDFLIVLQCDRCPSLNPSDTTAIFHTDV